MNHIFDEVNVDIEKIKSIRENSEITTAEIDQLSYVQILALLSESNRPPGGNRSISEYVAHLALHSNMTVLHAGCNAGFLTREMHRRTGATILGIDISQEMVSAANDRSQKERLFPRVSHKQEDMRAIGFENDYFDACFSGGALAFVDGHDAAVNEWIRVTKPGGMLGEIALYYADGVPSQVRESVEEIIKVKIPEYTFEYWRDLFWDRDEIEPYCIEKIQNEDRTKDEVELYCSKIIEFSLSNWNEPAKQHLLDKLVYIFLAFNENMKYLESVVIVSKKTSPFSSPVK